MNDSQSKTAGSEVEREAFEARFPKFWSFETFADDDGERIYRDDLVQGAWIAWNELRPAATLSHPATQAGALQAVGKAPEGWNGTFEHAWRMAYCDFERMQKKAATDMADFRARHNLTAATQPNAAPAAEVVVFDDEDITCMSLVIRSLERIASGKTETSDDRLFAKTKPRKMTINDAKAIAAGHLPTLQRLRAKMDAAPGAAIAAREQETPQTDAELQALEHEHMGDPDKQTGIYSPSHRIGWWLSAALEDPDTCEEMKADIRDWFASEGILAAPKNGYCDGCGGSGDQMFMTGGGPDAHEEVGACEKCGGTGVALASPAAAPTSQPNAAAQEQQAGWRDIATAPHTRKVLVSYLNRANKRRVVMACFYEEGELPMSDSYQGDEEFAEPGWYEECETADETIYPVEGEPTHWHEIPPAPAPTGMGSVGLPSGRGEEQS